MCLGAQTNLESCATHSLAPSNSLWKRATPGRGRITQAIPISMAAHGYLPMNPPILKRKHRNY